MSKLVDLNQGDSFSPISPSTQRSPIVNIKSIVITLVAALSCLPSAVGQESSKIRFVLPKNIPGWETGKVKNYEDIVVDLNQNSNGSEDNATDQGSPDEQDGQSPNAPAQNQPGEQEGGDSPNEQEGDDSSNDQTQPEDQEEKTTRRYLGVVKQGKLSLGSATATGGYIFLYDDFNKEMHVYSFGGAGVSKSPDLPKPSLVSATVELSNFEIDLEDPSGITGMVTAGTGVTVGLGGGISSTAFQVGDRVIATKPGTYYSIGADIGAGGEGSLVRYLGKGKVRDRMHALTQVFLWN